MRSAIRGNYRHTVLACYIGYITQAIVNNFAPLLLTEAGILLAAVVFPLGMLICAGLVSKEKR